MKINSQGLSLTELLVASMLVGIVMLGVIGFNVAVTTMQTSTQNAASGSVSGTTAISILRRDIEKAIGDSSHPGILAVHLGGTTHLLALRLEHGNTPDDYNDDNWICWSASDADPFIRRNVEPAYFQTGRPDPNPGFTLNNCTANSQAQEVNIELSNSNFFNIQRNAQGKISYIELTVSTLADTTTAADPISNPVTVFKTQVNPVMLSD